MYFFISFSKIRVKSVNWEPTRFCHRKEKNNQYDKLVYPQGAYSQPKENKQEVSKLIKRKQTSVICVKQTKE